MVLLNNCAESWISVMMAMTWPSVWSDPLKSALTLLAKMRPRAPWGPLGGFFIRTVAIEKTLVGNSNSLAVSGTLDCGGKIFYILLDGLSDYKTMSSWGHFIENCRCRDLGILVEQGDPWASDVLQLRVLWGRTWCCFRLPLGDTFYVIIAQSKREPWLNYKLQRYDCFMENV